MTKSEYRAAFRDVVYLCAKAINGEIPDSQIVRAMDLDHLYRAAKFHMLTAVCAVALEKAGIKDDRFTKAKGRAIRKAALLEIEAKKVFERLEAEKIWYLPLKGAVLKELYPATGLREMVDVYVLFDAAYRERLKTVMEELGYSAQEYGAGNHDCYQKEPRYQFEMHTELMDASYEPTAAQYYKTVSDRLLTDGQSGFAKRFSHEDFYIFILAHGYKHYRLTGIGLRFLLDLFVFLKRYEDSLQKNYIEQELGKLGLLEFELESRELAQKLFREIPLSESETELFEYYCFSGAMGTGENVLDNAIKRKGKGKIGKLRYIFSRLFPPMDKIKLAYPMAYRTKILLPFLTFYRLIKGFLFHRKAMGKEFRQLKK